MKPRKLLTTVAAAAVLSGAAGGVALAGGLGHQPAHPTTAGLQRILATLSRPGGLAHYGLPSGQLVWARACQGSACVAHRYGSTAPSCSGGVCLAPAVDAVRLADGVTLSVEER